MEGKRLLRSLTLRNILSFGPEGMTLDFEPLNVLIGPNGSGKSNLIEILGLIRALPRDLPATVTEGGGISEWLWKGEKSGNYCFIESEWDHGTNQPLQHRLAIVPEGHKTRVLGESISLSGTEGGQVDFYLFSENGVIVGGLSNLVDGDPPVNVPAGLYKDQSILAQRREKDLWPQEAYLGDRFREIRLYRNWVFGRTSPVREPVPADLPDDYLSEDTRNLSLILKKLRDNSEVWEGIIKTLANIYEEIEDIKFIDLSNYIYFSASERKQGSIFAKRLSDGTLRFLSLLAILCDPTPPALVCIEEPELGLHPDLISTIARLLINASRRTQLIVTTHSVELVTALWEFPESVVVCDRGFVGSRMQRLDPVRLKKWLDRYSLGELWMSGEIGGTRW